MKKLTPVEQTRMIRTLEEALNIVKALPVDKSCSSCEHWDGRACMKFMRTPPAEVQAKGCEAWESNEIPF